MRLGILTQPHRVGVAIQSYEVARHIEPTKVLLTDLTQVHLDNSRNSKRVSNVDWFNSFDRMTVNGVPNEHACKWLLDGIDVLFVVETPLNWDIFHWARQKGVKTVLQVNPEFLEYQIRDVPKPDLFLAPTRWLWERVAQHGKTKYLPVPIATDRLQRRKITHARRFIHITGHKAHLDRNGTEIVRQAIHHVTNPNIEIKIHDQSKHELDNYWELYEEGDVLLLPRRYGGLSLQLQEAAAVGMPVVVTENCPYANEPCTVTIPPPYHHVRVNLRGELDCYSATPQRLGEVISQLANRESIADLSEQSYRWAQNRSWSKLKSEYNKIFEELCHG